MSNAAIEISAHTRFPTQTRIRHRIRILGNEVGAATGKATLTIHSQVVAHWRSHHRTATRTLAKVDSAGKVLRTDQQCTGTRIGKEEGGNALDGARCGVRALTRWGLADHDLIGNNDGIHGLAANQCVGIGSEKGTANGSSE